MGGTEGVPQKASHPGAVVFSEALGRILLPRVCPGSVYCQHSTITAVCQRYLASSARADPVSKVDLRIQTSTIHAKPTRWEICVVIDLTRHVK